MNTYAEHRVFGPPGVGKTTFVSQQVAAASSKWGGANVLVSSFTKAAAAELAGRDLPIPRSNLGTLHALCFRALGQAKVADGKQIAEFNASFPQWKLTGGKMDLDEGASEPAYATEGDKVMGQLEILRARMVPPELWPSRIQAFRKDWQDWKDNCGLIDFTDMIELAFRDVETAPGTPAVGFFDETQDFTALELSVIRKWARSMNHIVLAGDDDQALYRFKGATPDAFLNPPIDPSCKRVLSQSYRVPVAVHGLAEKWIKKLSCREAKEYLPRVDAQTRQPAPGAVLRSSGTFKYPEPLLRHAETYLRDGKTVMFLATCSYMLDPLKAVLRKAGMPFHNPYRRKRGDWNPLAHSSKKLMPVSRVLAFAAGEHDGQWSWHDLYVWASVLEAKGVLAPGAKGWLESRCKGDHALFDAQELLAETDPAIHEALFALEFSEPEKLRAALSWWLQHVLPKKRKSLEYPCRVAAVQGVQALEEPPQIVIGTGHSVKGGEAQVVYVLPDLSVAGMREWLCRGEPQDSVRRLFYVMLTRCSETLVLCSPSSPCAVAIH